MKKISIILIALFACTVAFAGNPIKLITGKKEAKNLMKLNVTMCVNYDWSNAKYDTDKELKDQWGVDYDYIINDCEKSFINGFNENSNGPVFTASDENAQYSLLLKITNVDSYFSVMSIPARYEAKMWGHLTIVSNSTGSVVLEAEIDEAEDGKDFVPRDCFGKTFGELGKTISKMK